LFESLFAGQLLVNISSFSQQAARAVQRGNSQPSDVGSHGLTHTKHARKMPETKKRNVRPHFFGACICFLVHTEVSVTSDTSHICRHEQPCVAERVMARKNVATRVFFWKLDECQHTNMQVLDRKTGDRFIC
jgi:hypothetical protein